MLKRFICILIAPLFLLGCGEEAEVQRYESTQPIAFDWPVTVDREAEAEVNDMKWVWEVPAGWLDAPEVPDQLVADYRLRGANDVLPGRVTVSVIDGDAGGVNANVLRWLQQLYVTQARRLGPDDTVSEPMPVNTGRVTFVELHGQYQGEHMPTHIFAAILQIPAEGGGVFQTWFFKLAGDEATVDSESNRVGMAKVILSLRPKGEERPALPGIDPAEGQGEESEPTENAMTFSKNNPLSWLASLKLTVVLLAMSMYLIFVGTLAQVENGIWWVVENYFREGNWGVVTVQFDVFRSLLYPGSEDKWPGSHPFPSGYVLIGLLLINLLAAHAMRFKISGKGKALSIGGVLVFVGSAMTAFTVLEPGTSASIQQNVMLMMAIWTVPMTLIGIGCYFIFGSRKAGIVLVHGGLILMLVGEYVTGIGATEGQMWIHEKGASNKIIDIREAEIAFVRDLGSGKQEHLVIPQEMIAAADEDDTMIKDAALPLTVRIDAWMENSDLLPTVNGEDPTKVQYQAEEMPAVTGTEQRADRPSVMATLFDGDERVGQYLLTTWEFVRPVKVDVDGKSWDVSLRFKETHLPYTIQLVDFRHDKFTGTTTPMNYSSTLRLEAQDPSESRDTFIKMNQPLRYDGKAFFQSGFFQQPLNRNLGTIMQVADNPGAWVPYLSCVVVTVGLCMHFVVSLIKYGRRANAKA